MLLRLRHLVALVAILLAGAPGAAAQVMINEVMASNLSTVPDMVDYGDFEDWIELFNAGGAPVDLGGYALSDNPAPVGAWTFPTGTSLNPGAYLLVWADGGDDVPGTLHTRPWWPDGQYYTTRRHHTDFRLDQAGDGVFLFAPGGAIADSVTFGDQFMDVSLGRYPDGGTTWHLSADPSPDAANEGIPLTNPTIGPSVEATPHGGFFASPVQVVLDAGASIPPVHFTTNGSAPGSGDPVYNGPVAISETTVLRARAIVPGGLPGPVTTQTYFVGEQRNLPVVSVSTNPEYLWDHDLGIYLNSYKEREIPVGFEYYPDGEQALSIIAGARIGGENIYRFAQKPLNLYFRSEYGASKLDWPVFDDLPYFEYKRLYVRNGGDDWPGTLFRDGLVHEILKRRVGNAMQAFRPAVAYLNGAYWGIHNLREKIDDRWFGLHYGTAPGNLDHLEVDGTVITGDSTAFMDLLGFIRTTDLSEPAAFEEFEAQVDLDDLADFASVQSIISNRSWGHNREIWRDRGSNGRWRWVIVDTDRGFEMSHLADDMLLDQYENFEQFRAALANPGFRERFIRRLSMHLNLTFRPDRVVRTIDSLSALIAAEIPRHASKWSTYIDSLTIDVWGRTPGIQSFGAWADDVDELRSFAEARPAVVRDQVIRLFGLDGTARLTTRSEPSGQGRIRVEGESIDDGEYFLGIPITLDATPPPGLAFSHWLERSLGVSVPLIARGSSWRYLDIGSAPSDWRDSAFDDGEWPEGPAELGYGDGDEATVISYGPDASNKRITYYFRSRFQAPDPVDLVGLDLGLVVDDGAVVYLNGTEVAREGMPAGTIDASTRAFDSGSAGEYGFVHRYLLPAGVLLDGENVLAVEVHQSSRSSSDISFDLSLSARYDVADPVEQVVSTQPSFDYVPNTDAELVAVLDPVEANLVPGAVTSDLLMERIRSPYYVDGRVTVSSGAALRAEPGVELIMAPGSSLHVEGRLDLTGTADLPVQIRPLYPGEAWGSICIEGGAEWSVLEHVAISGSGQGEDPCTAAVSVSNSRVRLRDVTFDDVHLPIRSDDSELEVFDSRFGGVTGVGDYVETNGGRLVLEGSVFDGNDFVDMDAVDIGRMGAGTVIRGNVFRNFTGFNSDGVDLGDASVNILVEDNLFHDFQDKAVSVGQGSSVTVARNVIVRCGIGVGVKDSLSVAEVVHSTFHDTDIGVAVYEKHPERGGASASVTGSLFSASRTASIQVDDLSTISVSHSLSDTDDLSGEMNLRADPRLLDPDGLNVALQVTSPAIDAGDPALPGDPDGSVADVGARPFAGTSATPVVLNEVMYHASLSFDTDDWIELHNPTEESRDLSGWVLRDEADEPTFVFPGGTKLDGRGYLVLARRPDLFGALITGVPPPSGLLQTGLDGNGEGLWLYDAEGRLVDAVRYDDEWPWPTAADGAGPSLELIDPLLDNSQATSWRGSTGHGTPGWRNSTFVGTDGEPDDLLPTTFDLAPGYPNPFNPSTRIRYQLPGRSRVELRVYDALGRLVQTLVHGTFDAGYYETVWTASRLSSGVYFVTLSAQPLSGAPGYNSTRRSVLVK